MSSYSSTSLSSSSHYAPTDSSSSLYPSSPSTSPGTSPPSPLSLKSSSSTSLAPLRSRAYQSKPSQSERPHPREAQSYAQGPGIDPVTLVGRTLTRVRRSHAHPSLTLHFADGGAVQIRVVGYDPQFRGVPKTLESDSPVLNPMSGAADVKLTVKHAAMITLSDKAFQVERDGQGPRSGPARESRWTQKHAAFAVKFVEEGGWHCIWATLAEYDEKDVETCVFRNFADVYVDSLRPTSVSPTDGPSARPHARTNSPHSHPSSPRLESPSASKAHKPKRRARKNKKAHTPQARW
ncbi:hypothetical protein PYCCODRAFT_1474291 [Trametes coccinea BRFM310]|uniref:Uncharacterized protein n=1 Tax=Trametes coccinea (strain BRFM310) TaxID=1353009 RepID=A0A1Y2J1U8_TRAC3|nr:hypothetical protein PYCCODRAFT_1474291 [Trametes coccinea BRFM310]